jgi:hypothetical protein
LGSISEHTPRMLTAGMVASKLEAAFMDGGEQR